MKNLIKISLLAAAVAAVGLPSLSAAVNESKANKAAANHPRLQALLEKRGAIRRHIAKRLDLSAEQKEQLKATRSETKEAVKAIRSDASLTPEQKRAKVRETLQTARKSARENLTAEQNAKLGHARKHVKNRLGRG